MSKLSVVATPIGNLEDITLRALSVLKAADVVLCEDTRVTKRLLSHFGIPTPTISFHANSGRGKMDKILALLEEGKHLALVTDAGTPGVSDPGGELVHEVRKAFGASVLIEAIPGPSALAAALSIAGLRAATFTFYGFLPQKKGRETLFKNIGADAQASIFYESPHRIMKTLEALEKHLSADRRIGIYRELTKVFEESIVGTVREVREYLGSAPEKQRGEFVVIVEAV